MVKLIKHTLGCALKFNPGNDLPSQGLSSQVLSALESLTSVFGMGTGVASPPSSPGILFSQNYTVKAFCLGFFLRSSPRPISTGTLRTLLPLHSRPIYQIVSLGSYYLMVWEILS
jgi:hypothetical protein